jgi:hypothetical protein
VGLAVNGDVAGADLPARDLGDLGGQQHVLEGVDRGAVPGELAGRADQRRRALGDTFGQDHLLRAHLLAHRGREAHGPEGVGPVEEREHPAVAEADVGDPFPEVGPGYRLRVLGGVGRRDVDRVAGADGGGRGRAPADGGREAVDDLAGDLRVAAARSRHPADQGALPDGDAAGVHERLGAHGADVAGDLLPVVPTPRVGHAGQQLVGVRLTACRLVQLGPVEGDGALVRDGEEGHSVLVVELPGVVEAEGHDPCDRPGVRQRQHDERVAG